MGGRLCVCILYFTELLAYLLNPIFLWSSYFCKFHEQLNNAKILARKLVKIIYVFYFVNIIFARQN